MPAPVRSQEISSNRGNIYDALDAADNGDESYDVESDLTQEVRKLEEFEFDSVVVVDGAPVVDESKAEKLLGVVRKIFQQCGELKADGVWMPKDASGKKYKGVVFLDFTRSESAQTACDKLDNYRLDKSHTLRVAKLMDAEKAMSLEGDFKDVEKPEFVPRDHLKSWLLDPGFRDQFMIQTGGDYSVAFNNKNEAAEVVFSAQHWSDHYALWSPRGTFVCTIHRPGAAIWGGPKFGQLMKFHHNNVKLVDFSPCERYLVTWSPVPFHVKDGVDANTIVWDIFSGELLKSFLIDEREVPEVADPILSEYTNANMSFRSCKDQFNPKWPLLQWSFDGSYMARAVDGPNGALYVYESSNMSLLDKKSVKIPDLMGFSWSPSQPIVVYWTPEVDNSPARVTLMEIPSRTILRTKNLFNLASLQMKWQSNGDYLALVVELYNKSRKQKFPSLEICRMRDKDIPVEVVELPQNEVVTDIAWEHNGGHQFALLTKDGPKIFACFYSAKPSVLSGTSTSKKLAKSNSNQSIKVDMTPVETQLLAKYEKKGVNTIVWSPTGRFLVLGAVFGFQGTLEFWDAEELNLLKSCEHYLCTNIDWDPSGRYVLSFASQHKYETDTGYQLWSVVGDNITKEMINGLLSITWRPRPKTLLTVEQQKLIKKNLKDYAKEFEEADLALLNRASVEVQETRRRLWSDWSHMYERWYQIYMDTMPDRVALLGFDPEEQQAQNDEQYEQWEEVLLEEKEEIVTDHY